MIRLVYIIDQLMQAAFSRCTSYISFVVLSLLFFAATLTSCFRDDLCFYHPEGAVIELKIDWSYAQLSPNSATAVIFKDGRYFRTEIFSAYPPIRKEIFLPVGKYSFVVFNEQISEYGRSLHFSGSSMLSTFEARTIDDYMANAFSKSFTRSLKAEVDTLAADRMIYFEVTPAMIPESHVDPTPLGESAFNKFVFSVNFRPKRVFTLVDILLKVKNGTGYYFTQRNPAEMIGTLESYLLGQDRYGSSTVAHPIKFIQLPNVVDSKVFYRSTLQVVGLRDYLDSLLAPGSLDYRLNLPFTFSGGIESRSLELPLQAAQFVYTPRYSPDRPYHHLFIEVDLELPPLVNVGGMDANLEDWNEVDIPLDGPQRLQFFANNGSKEAAWWPCVPGIEVNLLSPFFITPMPNFEFREWNTEPDGTGRAYQSGDLFLMKQGGAIFYAIWNRTDLPLSTLFFHANNGSTDHIAIQRAPGLRIVVPENLFSPPLGKMFLQWNLSANGSREGFTPGGGATFIVSDKDMHFYAIWK